MSHGRLESHFFEVELQDDSVTKEQLIKLFFDMDFIENTEMFREDTIKLGFKTEAERVATELLANEDMPPFDIIEGCIETQCESSGYYLDYSIKSTRIENTYVISVAIMTEC